MIDSLPLVLHDTNELFELLFKVNFLMVTSGAFLS